MPEYYKRIRRTHYENNKEKEAKRLKEWQQSNPEKLREYRIKREQNKTHEISLSEWKECKNYFENSCGYCGMSEEEHISVFKQVLHRDHVDHDGANDLSNCIPACKSCNSSKHNFELNDWYNESNSDFTIKRLNKIKEWLTSDWEDYYENTN
jgi:5-methylcytosine-specific restriction endonuclease McrA